MKTGTKKSPLTKEELARQMKNTASKKLIIEQFFPALKDATISIDEATQLLSATTALIMEEAMETLRSKKMNEIKNRIAKKLCPDDQRLLQIEKLLGIFDSMSLFEARGHFEGMKAVLEQAKGDEMRSRILDSLKMDWARYLN